MKSRSFTIFDIPDPHSVDAKFVYNFFVHDEKTNDKGDSKSENVLKNTNSSNILQAEIPRYIEVTFSEVHGSVENSNSIPVELGSVVAESDITNEGFASLNENDTGAVQRLRQKLEGLSKSLGLDFTDSDQTKIIAGKLGVDVEKIQTINSPLQDPTVLKINSVPLFKEIENFSDIAAQLTLTSQINKRLAYVTTAGSDDISPMSKLNIKKILRQQSTNFRGSASKNLLSDFDVDPILNVISQEETQDSVGLISFNVLGYIIERSQYSDTGPTDYQQFFLAGANSNKFIDNKIFYGSIYSYKVRTVAQVTAVVKDNSKNYKISLLVKSKPASCKKFINTQDFTPPHEPDGVIYNFNYDAQHGLFIRWQIPSARPKSTKYFQIFRRTSIQDPFVCIAQIDFDDSSVKTPLKEQVRQDKIVKYNGAITYLEDKKFTRESKFIYAIAAVDAHGLTSGYSVQTQVGFDKIANRLTLKNISRGGAPKQYPNFYVDPREDENVAVDSFSQDAIFDSGHKKMSVYFTPDARVQKSGGGYQNSVFVTDATKGSYLLHTINLDVQKSATTQIVIQDLRNTSQ